MRVTYVLKLGAVTIERVIVLIRTGLQSTMLLKNYREIRERVTDRIERERGEEL